MTVNSKEYWYNKQLNGVNIIDVIRDYNVNNLSVNKLESKYHSSKNRILELLKLVGVLRSKSESSNRNNENNKSLNSFMHIPNSVMKRIAESGINKTKLANLFGISNYSKSFINKINDSNYDALYKKTYVKNMDEKLIWKAAYLRSINRAVFEVLASNFRDSELSSMMGISESLLGHLYSENNIYADKGKSLFVSQNFSNNRKLGNLVYECANSKDMINHIIDSFDNPNIVNFSLFFGNTTTSARDILNKVGISVDSRRKYGSIYEEKVYNIIQKVFGPNEVLKRWDRSLLRGRELDFYLPNQKIAVEVSPSETHATGGDVAFNYVKTTYHYLKREDCNSRGINLITLPDPQLSDSFIKGELPLMLKQFCGKNTINLCKDLTVEEVKRDIGRTLVNNRKEYTFGSNISKVLNIKMDNDVIATVLLGKNGHDALSKSVRIIDIFSDYVLPEKSNLINVLVEWIKSNIGEYTTIYAVTSYWHGTGKFLTNNGFVFDHSLKARPIYVKTGFPNKQLLTENTVNKSTKTFYYNKGYSEMYNCGAKVYRYNR